MKSSQTMNTIKFSLAMAAEQILVIFVSLMELQKLQDQ